MSRPNVHLELPTDTLRIIRWDDPVLHAVGHDPRSDYVERYWLALLGPSTTLLVRRLAERLERDPDGFDLHLEETARTLGLGLRGGRSGPFYRALGRTGQFHISRSAGPGIMAVRTHLQTLTHHQVDRLPPVLQAEHREWLARTQAGPSMDERRARARRLALSLLELGETVPAAEQQLHRWKIHPGLAHEAIRWAQARCPAAPTKTTTAAADAVVAAAAAAPIPPPPRRPRPVFSPADDAA